MRGGFGVLCEAVAGGTECKRVADLSPRCHIGSSAPSLSLSGYGRASISPRRFPYRETGEVMAVFFGRPGREPASPGAADLFAAASAE